MSAHDEEEVGICPSCTPSPHYTQAQLFTPEHETSYETFCASTDKYPAGPSHSLYLALGLASEVEEVAGKFKKALRDNWTETHLEDELLPELGDVLWYITRLVGHYGLTLADLAMLNRDKLTVLKCLGTCDASSELSSKELSE